MLPSLFYPLTFMSTSKKFLRSLDIRIRAACRKWLRIPKDVPVSFFHTISKMGDLGVPQLHYTIPLLKTAKLNKFADTTSMQIISNNALPKFSRNWERPITVAGETVTNKNELDNITAQMLYRSIDGNGLRQASEAKENGAWIKNGTLLLSGRDYIGALSCRGGYLHSKLRASRGQENASPLCECCGRIEDLAHILPKDSPAKDRQA